MFKPAPKAAAQSKQEWVLVSDANEASTHKANHSAHVHIAAISKQCRSMVTRRAALSAGASMVPIPGLDIAADVALLTKLINEINQAFGLTPPQIEKLGHKKKLLAYQAMVAVGGNLVGKLVTRELVLAALRLVGVRITTKQLAKYVPIAGQAAAAVLGFSAMRYLGNQHIKACATVAQQLANTPE